MKVTRIITASAGAAALAATALGATAATAAPGASSSRVVAQVLQYKVVNGHWLGGPPA